MTWTVTVRGVVQGVGFRPFVARQASALSLTGTVCNNGGVVTIVVNGSKEAMDELVHRLSCVAPPGAVVADVQVSPAKEEAFDGFSIVSSEDSDQAAPVLPADLPVCDACLRELRDPQNRRYRYPLISCVSCGPRYSILKDIPYDRETTTMDTFAMCPACKAEYQGDGRRRHAQTISCLDCGPQVAFTWTDGTKRRALQGDEAVKQAVGVLKAGGVVAVKGMAGYQLCCSPYDEAAVCRLRKEKGREGKPFAVLYPSLSAIRAHCPVSPAEEELLGSPARPIVLLRKGKDPFCQAVAGESRELGAFLPCTPLQQLLLDECGPLVATSANQSGQPMVFRDEEALSLLNGLVDGVLSHNREILTPLDDSVARVVKGKVQLSRRARGYVPLPVTLPVKTKADLLTMGGDLKGCFGLLHEDSLYLSQHLGDLDDEETQTLFEQTLARMERIFRIHPSAVICDRHPGYHSARLAQALAQKRGIPLLKVQHHHAHVASVMAEHGLGRCIGVAFDGTGYGVDGAVWGGEFLLCEEERMTRMAHLSYLPICGGDQAAKDASLTGLCYRLAAGEECEDARFPLVRRAVEAKVNVAAYSSMGRLFDGVSARLGLGERNRYEGECAQALENAATAAKEAGVAPVPLSFPLSERNGILQIGQAELFSQLGRYSDKGADPSALALGFHEAAAQMVANVCRQIRAKTGENKVALCGGVFFNRLLLTKCLDRLQADGFSVYLNEKTPVNDGSLALGQAYLGVFMQKKGGW